MDNKKLIILFIPIFCLITVLFLQGEQVYQIKALDYQIKAAKDGIHRISMNGYFSYAVPGYPDLPSKILRIAVPPDTDLHSIDVTYQERERASLGSFYIPELPPMETWIDGQRVIGTKAEIYSNDSYYPESTVEYLGVSQMRKWKIVNIKYTPFQYNPVNKDLIFIPEVTVSIKYEREDTRTILDLELSDTVMDDRAKEILANYLEIKEWYSPRIPALNQAQTYNYVIITTNELQTNSTKLNEFVSYLTDEGYSVKVITETDFGSLTGQSPNQKAEKIREWLKNNYVSMGIEYVLLIGNPSPFENGEGDIPMKMCWPYYDAIDMLLYNSPTDYFYADLTGNWDLDGDGYYGENPDDQGIGGVDFANEVYVGRIPVYSGVTELDSVLNKTIIYGNPPLIGWRRNVLLPMSFADASTDGAYLGEAMKSDYLPDSDFSVHTLYMQGSLCPEADSVFDSTIELIGLNVYFWWSQHGMVWWLGHGNQTQAKFGYDGCGWGDIMNTDLVPGLNDNYPSFVYQGSCENGFPENPNNLGAALLYNGAITTVSASRVSWGPSGIWNVDWKYNCDIFSIGYYYGRELIVNEKKAAVALYDVKSDMGINGGLWGGPSWMNLFDFNLYGSPESLLLVRYNLTITSNQGGTTRPPPGVYAYFAGEEHPIEAMPDTNYRFLNWAGDIPQDKENDNPIYIKMDSDKSIESNFIRQYSLTIAAGTGGSTDPTPWSYTHDDGTEVSVRAIPSSGYKFAGWSGSVVGSENPVTVILDSDKSMTANFRAIPKEDGDGGGLCFIATAAYGSSSHPHVKTLRDFRDKYLTTNKPGRLFVGLYYKYSPYVANIIARSKSLKVIVRIHLIAIIIFSYSMVYLGPIITGGLLLLIIMIPLLLYLRRNRGE